MTSEPGRSVGDAMGATVSVGSGVNVGGMDEAVNTGEIGVEAGVHPPIKNISPTSVRNTD
jgi:hypothetical protein